MTSTRIGIVSWTTLAAVLLGACAPAAEPEGVGFSVRPLRGAFGIDGGIPGCSDPTTQCLAVGILGDKSPLDTQKALMDLATLSSAERDFAPFDWVRLGADCPGEVTPENQRSRAGGLQGKRPETPFTLELTRKHDRVGKPLHLTVLTSGSKAIAHVGPFSLPAGYRARFPLALYPVFDPNNAGASTQGAVDILKCDDPDRPNLVEPPDTFAAAVTTLTDGRILVAGGFRITGSTDCPRWASAGGRAEATCASAVATNEVWIFAPSQGCFYTPQGRYLKRARGGARATRLPSGRVVVTGGAPEALVVHQQGMETGVEVTWLLPLDAASATMATFEVFEPDAEVNLEDPLRDGQPARGGFVMLGTLGQPRFLHAAALVPDEEGQSDMVLLAGGTQSPRTYEVLDLDRTGGPGPSPRGITPGDEVAPGVGRLAVERFLPSALSLRVSQTVWVIGGAFPVGQEASKLFVERWVRAGATDTNVFRSHDTAADSGAAVVDAPLLENGGRYAYLAPPVASGWMPVATSATGPAEAFVENAFVFANLGPACSRGAGGTTTISSTGWSAPEVAGADFSTLEKFLDSAAPGLFGSSGFCPVEALSPSGLSLAPRSDGAMDVESRLVRITGLPRHHQGTATLLDSGRLLLLGGTAAARGGTDTATPEAPDHIELMDAYVDGVASGSVPENARLDVSLVADDAEDKAPALGAARTGAAFVEATPMTPGGVLILPGVRRQGSSLEVAGRPAALYVLPRCFRIAD